MSDLYLPSPDDTINVATATAAVAPTADAPRPVSISARGLTKVYGKSAAAVDGVDLDVREGEFFGFLGPNGAGKSTTIKMLCGMLRPTQGAITVAGYDMLQQPLEVKRVIGVLPEETSLYERLTGREFLQFAGQMYGLPKTEAVQRSRDLLEVMELTTEQDKLIVDYSMGMKKKVALAASLIHRPRVLFLDEPFNGIDPVSVRAIRGVLQQLTAHGTTIFFSSHVMEVVERLCTRVAIIARGKIVGEGTIAELRERARSGDGSGAGDSSLEDIFLTLVQARPAGSEETLSWL
jgi:ABC-2 type transport system ATP-binding protein